jgi:hypothetical protein
MAKHDRSKPARQVSHMTPTLAQASKMLAAIEKTQVPFGESAGILAKLKLKIEANESLTGEEFAQLQRLANLAREWEKGVESSARTEPEETLAG